MKWSLLACLLVLFELAYSQPEIPKIHCNPVWVIIADTSSDHAAMEKVSKEIQATYQLASDTVKTYDSEKNLLCFRNVFDPFMSGKYTRRTMAGEYVSLEYLACYQSEENDSTFGEIQLLGEEMSGSTICVVAGIFQTTSDPRAKAFLEKLRKDYPRAYMIKRTDLDCYWVHY